MLMHSLDILLHDNKKKMTNPQNYSNIFVFSSYRKKFPGTQKRVRISHGKRAIGVRVIDDLLYNV